MSGDRSRAAVVLFNLGGPDAPAAVRPFLENLFADPAIISAPAPIRRPLAAIIAHARARSARANYALMGGGSPLLAQSLDQASALEAALRRRAPRVEARVFVAMRHWRPTTEQTAAEVARFAPDQIVLAPLYPQYSTTTTASSLGAWRTAYKGGGVSHAICCWYDNASLIEAHAQAITRTWERAGRPAVRLLFSAHGLPRNVDASGDPYRWQVEATCAAIARRLGPAWDWRVCYQSRVGPMKWLGPSTPEAIREAADAGLGVLVDPVSFVSEHIETLVELDRDYAELARLAGAAPYLRAPTVGIATPFIDGLAQAVQTAMETRASGTAPDGEACPAQLTRCPLRSQSRCR
ncbi:MAG TPA: ferrochelatase [Caulobacteraceae bacterium]